MSLTKAEQETIVSFNEAEDAARVYTHNPALQKKLKELQGQFPSEVIFEREEPSGGVFYTIPKRWVRVYPPRVMSEEQRARATERAKSNFSRKTPRAVEDF